MQHHLDARGIAVLGHVEAELADLGAGLWRPRLDVDDLDLAVLALAGADQLVISSRAGWDRRHSRGHEDECAETDSCSEWHTQPAAGVRVGGGCSADMQVPPERRVLRKSEYLRKPSPAT